MGGVEASLCDACVLAAYVAGADHLCEEIEAACAGRDPRSAPLDVGIDAALALLSSEPALAQLLCAQAPREAIAVTAARRLLVSRLAAMLRRDRGGGRGVEPATRARRATDRRHARLPLHADRPRGGRATRRPRARADRDPRPPAARGLS